MRKFLMLMSLATGLVSFSASAQDATPLIEKTGAACETDADCGGTGTRCLLSSSISGLTYPGGFCTVGCSSDADCGEGGACPLATVDASLFPSPEIQKAVTVCLAKCEADSDCREGYTCSKESSLSFVSAEENDQGYCQPAK